MGLGEVALGFLSPLLHAGKASGASVPTMLQRYDIEPAMLEQPDQWLSISRYMRIGHDLIDTSGNLALGLDAGQSSKLQGLGLIGPMMLTSPTLDDALECLVHYQALYSSYLQGQSNYYMLGRDFCLQFYSIKPYNQYNHFVVDFVLTHWYHLCTLLTGRTDHVKRVEIEFPAPPYIASYEKAVSCPVLFGQQSNRLILDGALISQECSLSAAAEYQLLKKLCDEKLQQVRQHETWTHRTMQVLSRSLTTDAASMEEIAYQLRVPVWTLKRKLHEEGTNFKEVQDQTRRNLAVGLLKESEYAISEIAWLTGFSSAEAFSRAFKRWEGASPGEFRKKHTLN